MLAILEAGKPKIRVAAWLDSGEVSVTDLLMASF